MKKLLVLVRPVGIALAILLLLNLLLSLRRPSLSAGAIFFYLHLREPLLSGLTGLLAAALLVPHAAASRPGLRLCLAGVFLGFLCLAGANIFGFYAALYQGRISTSLPVPFSALIALVLGLELLRVARWAPVRSTLPLPARRLLAAAGVAACFLCLILAHIVTFGLTDYTPAAERADAVVVLGAKVYNDGRLSDALEDRLRTAVRLYREGRARLLILTGGVEPSGVSEPRAMAAQAVEWGVRPQDIILDEGGDTTQASARNCGAIARAEGLQKLLVVSQYFHNARVKLIFEREGTSCFTVPAQYRRLQRERFFLFRETFAFLSYLFRPGSPA